MFVQFPENKPDKTGYYFTMYYNTHLKDYYCKSVMWNGEEWVFEAYIPDVRMFVPKSHSPFYVDSALKAHEIFSKMEKADD
jgi:hypothetical protein